MGLSLPSDTLYTCRRFFSLHFLVFSFSFFSANSIIILFLVLLFIQTRLLSTCNGSSPCVRKNSVSNTVTAASIALQILQKFNWAECFVCGLWHCKVTQLFAPCCYFDFASVRLLFDYKVGMTAFRAVGVRQRNFARAVCRQLSQLRRIDKQINSPENQKMSFEANHSNMPYNLAVVTYIIRRLFDGLIRCGIIWCVVRAKIYDILYCELISFLYCIN